MGIYIDMEMPKSYPICIVIDTAGQVRRYDLNNDRYADDKLFEAISVPTPHGRCIDADALIDDMANMIPWVIESPEEIAIVDGLSDGYKAVKAAPTVIPAEEGE